MKRKLAIAAVRAAGYHNDTVTGLHAYIYSRMSNATYQRELQAGREDRAAGRPCHCSICAMTDAAEVAADFATGEEKQAMQNLKPSSQEQADKAMAVRHAYDKTANDLGPASPVVQELRVEMQEAATDDAELLRLASEIGQDGELHPS